MLSPIGIWHLLDLIAYGLIVAGAISVVVAGIILFRAARREH